MSISESGEYDLLDQLAEEFAERFRRGERPSLKEYTDRYPDLADDIRELFPAMVRVEQAEVGRQGMDEERTGEARAANPHRDRSATTASSARSDGAAWAWCTRPSRSRWAATWR